MPKSDIPDAFQSTIFFTRKIEIAEIPTACGADGTHGDTEYC